MATYQDFLGNTLAVGDIVNYAGMSAPFEVVNFRPEGVAIIRSLDPGHGHGYTSTVPLRTLVLAPVICDRCQTATAGERPCCSSHGKALCHLCYRRTHFVEVCVAGCAGCAAEGLPVVLTRSAVA